MKYKGYTSRSELATAKHEALSAFARALCLGHKSAKIRSYAKSLGVSKRTLDSVARKTKVCR